MPIFLVEIYSRAERVHEALLGRDEWRGEVESATAEDALANVLRARSSARGPIPAAAEIAVSVIAPWEDQPGSAATSEQSFRVEIAGAVTDDGVASLIEAGCQRIGSHQGHGFDVSGWLLTAEDAEDAKARVVTALPDAEAVTVRDAEPFG